MKETSLDDPYYEQLNQDLNQESNDEGLNFFDIAIPTGFTIDRLDYEAGWFQLRYELSCSFFGADQDWIGQVVENPTRRQFGSYVFETEGFIVADSRRILQYDETRIVWESARYALSANQASRPKTIQLGALPIFELEPRSGDIPIVLQGEASIKPQRVNFNTGTQALGGPITIAGDLGNWGILADSYATISELGGALSGPLETIIAKEKLQFDLKGAEILFNEKYGRYENELDLGTIELAREPSKILFTLYQGVSADFTLKIYNCGLYREIAALPVYPNPPPGGGGGGGGGA